MPSHILTSVTSSSPYFMLKKSTSVDILHLRETLLNTVLNFSLAPYVPCFVNMQAVFLSVYNSASLPLWTISVPGEGKTSLHCLYLPLGMQNHFQLLIASRTVYSRGTLRSLHICFFSSNVLSIFETFSDVGQKPPISYPDPTTTIFASVSAACL